MCLTVAFLHKASPSGINHTCFIQLQKISTLSMKVYLGDVRLVLEYAAQVWQDIPAYVLF